MLNTTRVQCIILDVSLPAPTDGLRLAEKLRDDTRYCRTPLIFFRAHPLQAEERGRREPGAGAHSTKAFSVQQVIEEVVRLVPA